MATPTGSPAWSRTASADTYGGGALKTNYQSQGVTNPQTDLGAEEYSRMAGDTAAAVRVASLASIVFTADDVSPADPTVTIVSAMFGTYSTSYDGGNPPTGFPAVERVSNGVYDVTYEATSTDDAGVSQAVTILHSYPSVQGSTAAYATSSITAANVVRVYVFDGAGAALGSQVVGLEVA